ncbi:MAG: RHS repeat-associated core domain-containing protein [Phycisphaerales bacterium]
MKYSIDSLWGGRVTRAEEGTFSAGSISNRSRDQQWTLDQVGNWTRDKIDLNGDGDFVDTNELDDTRTHNVANELLTRDTDSNASVNYTLTHDAIGNMTDDGASYKFVYDVWGRLRMIKNQSNALVEEYRYNGLNHRLSWHYDTDTDGDCDSNDKTYYFAYDDQWRVVATFRESDTSPKERFLYHAAGLGGYGGAHGGIGGYIDHVIFRDRDANSGWTSAADGTLEERLYYCQNWRADVSAVVTSGGKMVEWVKYSAYGTPFALPVGDTDSDGDWDLTDLGNMAGGYEVRKDAELDGDVDANDINYAIGYGYLTLGRGVLSAAGIANRKGYAGYENDGAVARFWHVRNRVLDSTLGRWTRRDPIGYADGMGLFQYVQSRVVVWRDPNGLEPFRDPLDWIRPRPPAEPIPTCSTRIGDLCPHNGPSDIPVDYYLSDDECCVRAEREGCNPPRDIDGTRDIGGVICCQGRRVACSWGGHIRCFTPACELAKYLLNICTVTHERDHFDVTSCACCEYAICRPFPVLGSTTRDEEECHAYCVQAGCLRVVWNWVQLTGDSVAICRVFSYLKDWCENVSEYCGAAGIKSCDALSFCQELPETCTGAASQR